MLPRNELIDQYCGGNYMVQEKLKDNIYWVGVKDPNLKVFDIIMETK